LQGQVDYWADDLKGFGIRVSCGGTKTFQSSATTTAIARRVPIHDAERSRAGAYRRTAEGYPADPCVPAQDAVAQYLKDEDDAETGNGETAAVAFNNYFQLGLI